MTTPLYFAIKSDCESTQPAIQDAALGRRSSIGFAETLESHGCKGTFYCIPSEVKANGDVYADLKTRGHEIGLHVHAADLGYEEFLGIYGPDEQRDILVQSTDQFEQAMGFRPDSVCLGYGSSNDYTRMILVELGYKHGATQVPGRILPECASVAAGAPTETHYGHRWNRVLAGDLDFVEIPNTTDPESMMWGGKHPQDLRIELVDAKNHYYTILKHVKKQVANNTPVKAVVGATHNIFEFGDPANFRRQTLEGVIEHTKRIAADHDLEFTAVTDNELAAAYRKAVPLPTDNIKLELDRRGYATA